MRLLLCAVLASAVASCAVEFNTTDANGTVVTTFMCKLVPGSAGTPPQCVCGPSEGPWRSLPHVLIAGAQKAGTTMLFSYLTLHPNFAPPARKEVHAFDVIGAEKQWTRNPRGALQTYLLAFPHHNPAKVSVRCSRQAPSPPFMLVRSLD